MFVCVALSGIHTKKSKVCQAPEQLLSTSLNSQFSYYAPQGRNPNSGFSAWEHLIYRQKTPPAKPL